MHGRPGMVNVPARRRTVEGGRTEDDGRGDEESESSRPEHVGEGECEVLKAEAVAGSDDDEPRVYGVVGERPCSSPTFYTALPEALLLALPMATRRI